MIQERPVCFGCENVIESVADAVFSHPFIDDPARKAVSAIFHPLCLMEWREHRDKIKLAIQRHFDKKCSCYGNDEETEDRPEWPPPPAVL